MNKRSDIIKFTSYTTRFARLYAAWRDEKSPRRSERLRRMLDRQLRLDCQHYERSGQIAWAMERRKGLSIQPLPTCRKDK
jgi:hypothetical protein